MLTYWRPWVAKSVRWVKRNWHALLRCFWVYVKYALILGRGLYVYHAVVSDAFPALLRTFQQEDVATHEARLAQLLAHQPTPVADILLMTLLPFSLSMATARLPRLCQPAPCACALMARSAMPSDHVDEP